MIQRDTCYFCTSSFQFIPIMALALARNENADLYIDPQFENAEVFADRIRKTGVFHSVIVINRKLIFEKYIASDNRWIRRLRIFKNYLTIEDFIKDAHMDKVFYRSMFASSKAFFSSMLFFFFVKKKYPTDLLYFEDGTGSYIANYAYDINISELLARRLIFGEKALQLKREKYLFSPAFYDTMNPGHTDKINKLPQIIGNEELIGIYNSIFLYDGKQTSIINEHFILVDVLKTQVLNKENTSKLIRIYEAVLDKTGYKDAIVKKHPRSVKENEKDKKIKAKYYSDTGVPFELICMNTDMNQKVLISYGSTALGTPKILLNQEPFLILLHRLLPSKLIKGISYSSSMDKYFLKLAQLYSDQTKIYIPNNVDELNSALRIIKSKLSLC